MSAFVCSELLTERLRYRYGRKRIILLWFPFRVRRLSRLESCVTHSITEREFARVSIRVPPFSMDPARKWELFALLQRRKAYL